MQPTTTLETDVLDASCMPEELFTAADLRQMAELGIDPEEAARQVELFRNPPPFLRVVRPCTPGDGIRMIFESDHDRLLGFHEEAARQGRIGKFVSASGTASQLWGSRTLREEHLVEAAACTRDADGVCRLHFTVPPGHEEELRRLLEEVQPCSEERLGARFQVSFSSQSRSTDTLAVDLENRPFRLADDSLLFRPGGHGALIRNLHALAGMGWDVVLLKNIDNVIPEDRQEAAFLWKKLLAGALLALQKRIFGYLERLEDGPSVTPELLEGVEKFMTDALVRPVPPEISLRAEELRRYFLRILDRPLRVCGVVRNQEEPGGGPFWVETPGGEVSLQIVETSQIDPDDPAQQKILRSSTHFAPVDIACALRDRHGRPYELERYVDPTTVLIQRESHEGRPLKALEWPGLWTGAMAGWNTVFVEVPDRDFAPL